MGFSRVRDLVDKLDAGGQTWYTTFRKVPPIASVAGNWVDLSGAPGNPRPNYYTAPELEATRLTGGYGIFHGGNVAPATKHLHKLGIMALNAGVTPAAFILCDYLLFYPLVDMDSVDEQALTNPVALPRYADGNGVQAFLVATNPYIGGAPFYINYINANGNAKQSRLVTANTATYISTLVNSGTAVTSMGPFIPLCPGCTGIRSVSSITFLAPNGGLAALVLVKPLATIMTREITTYAEFDFFTMKPSLPRIYDGAYLNLLCCPTGSVATIPIIGEASFIWG